MALETGNYINDLVITNPTSSDPKSQGDDHFQLIKKVIKECLNGFTGAILLTATDTGTAAAHVLTPTTALVGYTTGLMLLYRPTNAGTGALTVNVSGLGAKSVKTIAGADPTSGDILVNQPILLMYDGTNFVLLAGSEYLSKTGNQTLTGNLTLTGDQTVSGTLAVTGASTFTGDIGGTGGNKKANLASPTFTGTVTLPATGSGSTEAVRKDYADGLVFAAVLPAQTGNAGKYITTDGTTASWGAADLVIRSARTSNTILADADRSTLVDITSGTFSQTFTAAATLGSGWNCYIRNSGTGYITLEPNGAELIDGLTNYVMYPGETRLIQCDGTGFYTVVLTAFKLEPSSTMTFVEPPGYKSYEVLLVAPGGGGGSGRRGAPASYRGGGAGGGAGTMAFAVINAGTPGTSITLEVGANGTGGAAVAVNTTDGNPGTTGGTHIFGSLLEATGGGGGAGGSTGASTEGAAAAATAGLVTNTGTAGAAGSDTTGAAGTAATGWSATGGGSGGGINAGNTAVNGGAGGASGTNNATTQLAGGIAGVAAGTRPGGNGNSSSALRGGSGGGGGASHASNAGADGGIGVYGGGGGGGSASANGTLSGAGGSTTGYFYVGGIC